MERVIVLTLFFAVVIEEDCCHNAKHALGLLHKQRNNPVSVAACLRRLSCSNDIVGPSNNCNRDKVLCCIIKLLQITVECFVWDNVGVVVAAHALLQALAAHHDLQTSSAAA